MKLPFFNDKKEQSEYYLALILMDEKVSAVVLEAADKKIKILSKHEELFPHSVENIELEELIDIVDKSVSRAEEVLPPNIETHKTVFGVKKGWIEEETKKIKKEYLANLKKLCGALDLSPIGFMVTQEAVTHLIQEEEGVPLSAILAEIGKNQIDVTLFRGGKVTEAICGPVEESAPATVDKLLKHFTVPVLPARIILLHAEKDEKLNQQFISYPWSKSLPFLHVPQITVLPEGFDGHAVTFGAATQMGFEVLDTDKHPMPKDIESASAANLIEEEANSDVAGLEKTEHEEVSPPHAADFGFVIDQDIAEVKSHKYTDAQKPTHHLHHEAKTIVHHKPTHHVKEIEDEEVDLPAPRPVQRSLDEVGSLGGVGAFLSRIKLPRFGLPKTKLPLRLIIPLLLLLILIGGVAYFYFFKVTATVVLTVKPKIVEETTSVVFSTTSPNDFPKNIIAAKAVSANVEGEASIATTGKKDIGEKAKGKVTIYNISDSEQELSEGTSIKSSNGLTFILDKDVKIASGSSDPINPKSGTAQVAATAKEIGTDSNLPSGTKFTVGGNTTLAAKNDSAFSGGSKKSITAVSKEDLAKLRSNLLKTLEGKARESLSEKAGSDEILLPFYTNTGFSKTKFDKSIGDEAKTVKLTASATFKGIAYKESELTEYAKSLLKKKYAQDIKFAEDSTKETVKSAKEKGEEDAEASLLIQAGLLPKIDTQEAIKKISNKSPKEAQALLSELPQVDQSKITFSPNVFFLPNIFSRLPRNINVVVESE